MSAGRISQKAGQFTESVIREMTRLARQHQAINLAQGFPDFPAPEFIKAAACQAIEEDINQYAITWGSPRLREAVATTCERFYDWDVDPDREVTVCCGATECMIASILALVNPGERVAVFEPFYENYGPDTIIAGARPIFIPLQPQRDWQFDPEFLSDALGDEGEGGVRALILNTPNNPSGKVFSLQELEFIADLANRYDFYVITDEIYEHIIYEGAQHHPIALLPGMKERTVTISGLSKTFSVTGWRIGYTIAPEPLTAAIRKMHDFLTVGAAAPLQEAAARALNEQMDYFQGLKEQYRRKRDLILEILEKSGFKTWKPLGAYYVMTDISRITEEGCIDFVRRLITDYQVAAVPGSSFYHQPPSGHSQVRFAFCKTEEVLEMAGERLLRLARDLS